MFPRLRQTTSPPDGESSGCRNLLEEFVCDLVFIIIIIIVIGIFIVA